jgi:NAD(P)-dependent dehydrogenase (short-subunit alcohol dehydrogenase family)
MTALPAVRGGLAGKVIVITGATVPGSIGTVSAQLAAEQGAIVVVTGRRESSAKALAQSIRARGGEALGLHVDLSDENSIEALFARTLNECGGLDVLVNNAAITSLDKDGPIGDLDTAVWDAAMHVNLRGTMLACKYAIPHLQRRGGGAIINVSSMAGLRGSLSGTAYGVSKGAINTLTQYVATQYGKDGIRCNAIAAGVILTSALRAWAAGNESQDSMLRHCITPRLGDPADIAAAIIFLAGEGSGYINGQVIQIDGGTLAHAPGYADRRQSK